MPCLRIQRAKRGSVCSSASAKSLEAQADLWKGQYARWHFTEQNHAVRQRVQSARLSREAQFSHSFSGGARSCTSLAAIVDMRTKDF